MGIGDPEGLTGIQRSLSCALATIKSKIFSSDKDCIGVLGFGTRSAKSDDCDFLTVRQVVPLGRPSSAAILSLEELLDPDSGSSEFEKRFGSGEQTDVRLHEALWQCQSSFASITGKVGRKTLLLLTNSSDPHGGDSNLDVQARRKAVDLHNTDIFLDVVPVISDSREEFDLARFYHVLVKLADDETPLSVSNLSDLTGSILAKTATKRSAGHLKFNMGAGLTIGLSTYHLLGKVNKPSKQKLASDTNEEILSSRNWVHPITRTPLLPSDMNRFVEYGGKNIQMSADEVKAICSVGSDQPSLKLCGFKRVSSLKLGNHVRAPQFLYPNEAHVVGSKMVFSALLQRCHARQVAAICQYKPRATSKLCCVALVPQVEENDDGQERPSGFHVVFLPYLDDLRKIPEIPLTTTNPPESVEAAKEVIAKLRLKKFVPVENCSIQTHYKMIEAHALQKPTMEKLEDETLPDMERMTRKLGNRSSSFLSCVYEEDYDAEFPRKKVAKTVKKPPASEAVSDIDMKEEVASGNVKKLTVNVLKSWLKQQGFNVGNKKKAELIEDIIDQF